MGEDEANIPKIEAAFKKFCKPLKLKENRFCYYLGGTADAATGNLGAMSKPLSWGMPSDKVCEKLKKTDRRALYIGENYFPLKPKELSVRFLKTSGERDACAVQNRFSLNFLCCGS